MLDMPGYRAAAGDMNTESLGLKNTMSSQGRVTRTCTGREILAVVKEIDRELEVAHYNPATLSTDSPWRMRRRRIAMQHPRQTCAVGKLARDCPVRKKEEKEKNNQWKWSSKYHCKLHHFSAA